MKDAAIDYAVVGLGLTGRAVARYLRAHGKRIVGMDTRAAPPDLDGIKRELGDAGVVTGLLDEAALMSVQRIVLSPGVPRSEPAIRRAEGAGVEVIGDIELFAEAADAPIVAVTGTNGKSTVTTLVGAMLGAAGRDIRCGANLGTPALDLLGGPAPDFYVLELSSFQLELAFTLAPEVACILNVTPDHLDRHGSFAAYVSAKARILSRAKIAVMNADDPATAALPFHGRRLEFTLGEPGPDRYGLVVREGRTLLAGPVGELVPADDLALKGRHNIANALAAVAICEALDVRDNESVCALKSFAGLEHRAELVAEIRGVAYVNDSKATNPGAACAAIEGIGKPHAMVLIAGGVSKGANFEQFAAVVAKNAHTVVLIGTAAPQIAAAIGDALPLIHATDMRAAVRAAASVARAGDTVLLSPACASLDMYENYEARGRSFREAVRELAA